MDKAVLRNTITTQPQAGDRLSVRLPPLHGLLTSEALADDPACCSLFFALMRLITWNQKACSLVQGPNSRERSCCMFARQI